MKTTTIRLVLAFLCLSVAGPKTHGVSPPPDGGYPGGNTAEGTNALQNLDFYDGVGVGNTAVGWYSLFTNSVGRYCTAVGAGALALNIADENTAVGAAALLLNDGGVLNTAVGTNALDHNGLGSWNCAFGVLALANNELGGGNCAFGTYALAGDHSELVLEGNNAFGFAAMEYNLDGYSNNAFGAQALQYNVHGYVNNAVGLNALWTNVDGSANEGFGYAALADNVHGNGNVAIGDNAGKGVEGNFNIYIGFEAGPSPSPSPVPEDETIRIGNTFNVACYIGGIDGATVDPGTGAAVFVDANGKLGTVVSSKRFKDDIKPMDKASEAVFALKPVTFHYKKEIDALGTAQFGLVAEDVEKVNPQLVVRDKAGKPYSVRYDQVNAMLLNEFLKEHRKVEQLEKQIEQLSAGLQKVSAQLEANKPAPQTVVNNR